MLQNTLGTDLQGNMLATFLWLIAGGKGWHTYDVHIEGE